MFLVPWIAIFPRRRRLDLIGMRRLFLHVGVALVELTLLISSISVEQQKDSTWAWVLLGVGTAGCVGGLVWSTSRWRDPHDPADLSSAERVANGFRALSFIRLGLAASPALYGIVGTQLTETAELSFVGAAVSVVLIALYGPTRARVDEIQERLRVAGSPISLRAALDDTAS
jgi:sulfite exporter TauE/SafE